MSGQKLRDQLELKPVSMRYLDQFNELLRYVFQVTNQDLTESGYEEGEIVRAKRPILKNAEVMGWFHRDHLVSQICIYPCWVNIHNKIFQMGGVTGVGTYPEYSGMGLMNDLIRVSLAKMREKGQWISYLYPYSIPYYRRKGWEMISEHLSFTLKDTQIPKFPDLPGYVERVVVDSKVVMETYDRFARSNHGAMIRDKLEWDEYWRWENEEERNAAVYYDSDNQPQGFLIYWIAADVFHFKEMIYLNQEARKGLWNFIHAHFSMIDQVQGNNYRNETIAFFLKESQITETIEPYFMARIVDVEKFLTHYPFIVNAETRWTDFYFEVMDPVADWNQGIFSLSRHNGEICVQREPRGQAVRLDIQTLTSLLMSFRSPTYFDQLERLQTDAETLQLLEQIIPRKRPYYSDYF